MSVRSDVPLDFDWQEALSHFESLIDRLGEDSSPDAGARIQECAIRSLMILARENPKITSIRRLSQGELIDRCQILQAHFSKLEKQSICLKSAASVKGATSPHVLIVAEIEKLADEIQKIMKKIIYKEATDKIGSSDLGEIEEIIESIKTPNHIKIALALAVEGGLNSVRQSKVKDSLKRILSLPKEDKLNFNTILVLIELIPRRLRFSENIELFIKLAQGMTEEECVGFIQKMREIDNDEARINVIRLLYECHYIDSGDEESDSSYSTFESSAKASSSSRDTHDDAESVSILEGDLTHDQHLKFTNEFITLINSGIIPYLIKLIPYDSEYSEYDETLNLVIKASLDMTKGEREIFIKSMQERPKKDFEAIKRILGNRTTHDEKAIKEFFCRINHHSKSDVIDMAILFAKDERTFENIDLVIDATQGMTEDECVTFVESLKKIPIEYRISLIKVLYHCYLIDPRDKESIKEFLAKIDFESSLDLIELIPDCQITQKNILLCIRATQGMTKDQIEIFFEAMEAIDAEDRIAILDGLYACYPTDPKNETSIIQFLNKLNSKDNINIFDLLELIPEHERTPKNILLFIKATKGMTEIECGFFCDNIEEIPDKDRILILESLYVYYFEYANRNPESISLFLTAIKKKYSGLHLAAESGNLAFLRRVFYGRERLINFKNYQNQTPLYFAVELGHIELLDFLIQKGADPKIRDNMGITPYMLCRMKGIPIPLRLAPYCDELGYRLKMASLIWGMSGEASLERGTSFKLDGGEISVPLSEKIGSLSFLPSEVQVAFSQVKAERNAELIIRSIKEGRLTLIPTGYNGHAMTLVFYQDLVFVCNRGEGAKGGALRCFRIKPDKIDSPAVIQKLLDMKYKEKEEALEYYYHSFPASLSSGDELEITSQFLSLEPKQQSVGNCSAASTKLAIRAALAALVYKEGGDVSVVRAISKRATRELRDWSYRALEAELAEKKYSKIRSRVLGYFRTKKEKFDRAAGAED